MVLFRLWLAHLFLSLWIIPDSDVLAAKMFIWRSIKEYPIPFHTSIRFYYWSHQTSHGEKYYASDFGHSMAVGTSWLIWIFQNLLISRDFHPRLSLMFTLEYHGHVSDHWCIWLPLLTGVCLSVPCIGFYFSFIWPLIGIYYVNSNDSISHVGFYWILLAIQPYYRIYYPSTQLELLSLRSPSRFPARIFNRWADGFYIWYSILLDVLFSMLLFYVPFIMFFHRFVIC